MKVLIKRCIICGCQFKPIRSDRTLCYKKECKKKKAKKYQTRYYAENRNKLIGQSVDWGKRNRDKRRVIQTKYREKHRIKLADKRCFSCGETFTPKNSRYVCCSEECSIIKVICRQFEFNNSSIGIATRTKYMMSPKYIYSSSIYKKQKILELRDSYIRGLFVDKYKGNPTIEQIEQKRLSIKIKRKINEINRNTNSQ
jgi:hypothetical protein